MQSLCEMSLFIVQVFGLFLLGMRGRFLRNAGNSAGSKSTRFPPFCAAMIAILSFAKCQENMQASTPTQTHIPF